MMIMKCKCGNDNMKFMMVKKAGPHKKVTCGLCGKFIKFATKEDVNLLVFNGAKMYNDVR